MYSYVCFKIKYLIVASNIIFCICIAQNSIGDWDALTSPLKVNDLAHINGITHAATGGGLFIIDEENQYVTLTTVDGLKGIDLSSIAYDQNEHLWIGGSSPEGFLQLYDLEMRQSIQSFDFGLTSIIDIQINNYTTWVLFKDGQDKGIMKYNYDKEWQYRDSYKNYPSDAGSINCFSSTDSILYVGMSNGLFYGKINENLKDPNNWRELVPDLNGNVSSIILSNEKLVFSVNNVLFEYSFISEDYIEIEFSYDLSGVDKIQITDEGYWIIDGETLYLKSDEDYLIENRFIPTSVVQTTNHTLVGLLNGILFIDKDLNDTYQVKRFLANAPATNNFSSITVLNDGRVVCGSGHGISIYDYNNGWRNILEYKQPETLAILNNYDYSSFIADTVPYDFGEYISDLEEGPDGLLYCAIRGSRVYSSNPSRWSGGVIIIDIDNPENITVIDTTFLSYHTTSGNSVPYQVTLDLEFDDSGNLWIANPYCINGNNPIHVRSPDGEWKHYGSSETTTRISQSPASLSFDSWGRLWVSAFQAEEANLGIYPNGGISMLTFSGDPYAPLEFRWNIIEYTGTVWSLALGMEDRLYFLTPTGLNYYDLDNNYNPVIRENLYSYFPNISFGNGAGISIDMQGNTWTYSPTQGIHVLLKNTTYWPDINGFRSTNSPLLSDEVRDIDFNERKNLAYIATSKGVSILRIPFGNPKSNYSSVKIFPSPFHIPSLKPMIVDGLMFESSMFIMTLDGKVIKKIPSRGLDIDGDQLFWDGKDSNGEYVSSGVYLIMIYGENGSHHEEKITVINKK